MKKGDCFVCEEKKIDYLLCIGKLWMIKHICFEDLDGAFVHRRVRLPDLLLRLMFDKTFCKF